MPTARVRELCSRWGYRGRLAALAALGLIAYGLDLADVVADAAAGSRLPMVALTPVLAVLIASGYQRPPAGVIDNESDWLVVAVLGTIGFTGIALVSTRFETLAGLWRLDLLSGVLWTACAAVILLGARHAQRMWRVWLFAVIGTTPVPFALAVGALGGSDAAVAGVGVCFGATAAYLAGARAPRRRRLSAAALCLGLGWCLVFLLAGRLPLFMTVTIAAAVVPVWVTVGMRRWFPLGSNASRQPPSYPARSWQSLVALPLLALLVAVVHPATGTFVEPATAPGDWTQRAGLHHAIDIPDVQRFLGAEAQFLRYAVPASPGLPAAAVDVITTANLASLRDHHNTVWYPSTRPLNFTTDTTRPVDVRMIYSNADTATDSTTPHWYALTWEWRTDAGYQQVTVIVNQHAAGTSDQPPAPAPPTAAGTVLGPVLWIGRQQADSEGPVDEIVVRRATEIADSLLADITARA